MPDAGPQPCVVCGLLLPAESLPKRDARSAGYRFDVHPEWVIHDPGPLCRQCCRDAEMHARRLFGEWQEGRGKREEALLGQAGKQAAARECVEEGVVAAREVVPKDTRRANTLRSPLIVEYLLRNPLKARDFDPDDLFLLLRNEILALRSVIAKIQVAAQDAVPPDAARAAVTPNADGVPSLELVHL